MFAALVFVAAIVAGAVAAVAGFGIGSIMTPLLAASTGFKVAVAAVSIAHFIGTVFRCWLLRRHIDWQILKSFGVMSAVGGLLGALLNSQSSSPYLGLVLGALLLFVGISGLTGLAKKMEFKGVWAWIAGGVSGLLGGLVGNQGGLRSGAMLGLNVSKAAFVATATATGVVVDVVRMPVYICTEWHALWQLRWVIALAGAGVLVGTELGMHVLARIPDKLFRAVVSILLLALAAWSFWQAAGALTHA